METLAFQARFRHFPRGPADVNALKSCLIPIFSDSEEDSPEHVNMQHSSLLLKTPNTVKVLINTHLINVHPPFLTIEMIVFLS